MKPLLMVSYLFWPIDRGLALVAYVGVGIYRRWISPHKGYRCAHGALTGEPSCSTVALEAFRTKTFTQAIPLIREQFNRCRRSYAAYWNDLISAADAHLTQFGALALIGAIECCPDGDKPKPVPPPPPLGQAPAHVVNAPGNPTQPRIPDPS